MAIKTKNIADLGSISANSAEILGKSSGSVGYISGLLDESGNLAGVSSLTERITQLETIKNQFETLQQNLQQLQSDVEAKADESALTEHTSNTDIHVTAEDKTTWSDKYTKAEVDAKLAGLTGDGSIEVDQTYNGESTNAQSGTAVAEAILAQRVIKDNGNTAYMSNEKNGGLIKFTKSTGEVGKITTFDGSDSDGTYIQLVAHNQDKSSIAKINFTTSAAYYSTATVGDIAIPDNEIATQKTVKDILASLVDQTYNGESTNAQSGTAVAEAIKDLAKKTDIEDALNSKLESMMHYKGQVATEGELPGADQVLGDVYNVEETGANYAWNGTSWDKLSEDISGFATKTELAEKAAQSDLDTLDGRVDALEAKPGITVDQTYNAVSTNPQSGTAVAEAIYNQRNILNEGNLAYMSNETSGGIIKFIKANGEGGKVTTYDGSDSDGTYVQISTFNQDKSQVAKINFTLTGAYYSKESSGAVAVADNELVTKKDIKDIVSSSTVTDLQDRVTALEEKPDITVDQTYSAESENAQSGKAVKEGLDSFKTEIQGLIDSKVESVMHYKGQVATEGELPGADQVLGDVYNVEETGANYAWNGTSWDKLAEDMASASDLQSHINNTDIHVDKTLKDKLSQLYTKEEIDAELAKKGEKLDYDKIKQLTDTVEVTIATHEALNTVHFVAGEKEEWSQKLEKLDTDYALKTELAEKAAQSDLDTLDGRVDALEAKPEPTVDQTYDAESTNAQSGTAVREAIKDLATKTELAEKADQSALTDLTDRVTTLEEKPEPTIDQAYNSISQNAQSGVAVAQAISGLATKTEVAEKAAQSDLDTLDGRVDTLEAKPEPIIDQTYTASSPNAISGVGVADALQKWRTNQGSTGTAYMANEANGGVIKFIATSGDYGRVTVYDGSDTGKTFVQLCAGNQDDTQVAKINISTSKAYYLNRKGDPTDTDEIVTVGVLTTKIAELTAKITELEEKVTALQGS